MGEIYDVKSKRKSLPLPDVRLAKVFKFTSADLTANRSGYLSRRQRGWGTVALRGAMNWVTQGLGSGKPSKPQKRHVIEICGRAQLVHQMLQRSTFNRTNLVEYFFLTFKHSGQQFPLRLEQYHALSENLAYRIYFEANSPRHILSIERALNDCQDGVS